MINLALKYYHQSLFMQITIGIGTFISILLLFVIYKMVLRPIYGMRFYRKQGIECFYFPLIGKFQTCLAAFKEHGDAKHHIKRQAKTNPQRAICSNLGGSVTLALYDPSLVKEFYLNSDNYIKDPIFLECFSPLLGKGLLTSEGNQWKAQRKVLSNAFHFGFLKSVLPSVQVTTRENLFKLRDTSLNDVNLMDFFQGITGEVVGKIFFGEQLNQYKFDNKPLTSALADLMVQVGILNLSLERHLLGTWIIQKGIFPKHKKIMQKMINFRSICKQIIEERKNLRLNQYQQTSGTKDMLDLLLEYNGEEGKMTDEGIIDQFLTFFMAGMDTTGHLVTMAAYFLEKYPDFKKKMVEEVRENYPLEKEIDIDDLNKLEFTMAFLKETLRMATPVPGILPRRAIRDHQLKDIQVKKGDIVDLDYFYNNFHPEYFQNGEKFDPIRWFDKSKTIDAYAFTPFSAGPRNCIGQHLALNEARIILAELLSMYDFHIKEDYTAKMVFSFLYEPEQPILASLIERK